ncbi:unnamed protein product [Caenorhabditis sp. 36 PRJEB53466]|nr:unnamed protein product [Caenorhabditis sp. 36 PRJEB53466]
MTIKIEMKVEQSLLEIMNSMPLKELEEVCDDRIQMRIQYLETVIYGWKTYKSVRDAHRHTLFLMLLSNCKHALHEYEERVLYPKLKEKEAVEKLLATRVISDLSKATDVCSTSSTADLGAESMENSTTDGSSGSQSPVTKCPTAEQVGIPEIVIDDVSETQIEKTELKISEEKDYSLSNEQTSAPKSADYEPAQKSIAYLRSLVTRVEGIQSAEDQEDNSVVGVTNNIVLSEGILKAAEQVKKAINNVNAAQVATLMNLTSRNGSTPARYQYSRAKTMEIPLNTKVTPTAVIFNSNEPMSHGMKKRAKKAAKKAVEAADIARKSQEEKELMDRQARLAAEALLALQNKANGIAVPSVAGENGPKTELRELPLTNEELEKFVELTKQGIKEYPVGSEEAELMKKVNKYEATLKNGIFANLVHEKEVKKQRLKQIETLSKQVEAAIPEKLSIKMNPEESLQVTRSFILEKLSFWSKSDEQRAPHFVQMYQYFLNNWGFYISSIIMRFISCKNISSAEAEATMLLQFQAGRYFSNADHTPLDV